MTEYTKHEQQWLRHLISDRIGLCGCGSSMWPLIKHLLEIAEDHDKKGGFYDPEDAQWPWLEFAAKVLDIWKLCEHGRSIGYQWLTDDGKKLLEFLRDVDDLQELPEFTYSCGIDEEW